MYSIFKESFLNYKNILEEKKCANDGETYQFQVELFQLENTALKPYRYQNYIITKVTDWAVPPFKAWNTRAVVAMNSVYARSIVYTRVGITVVSVWQETKLDKFFCDKTSIR